jgi:nitroimidazol reductase NimA-like FMN-containing flavoprotein (pyridoxamine 5'-phosphate oxidase superfamily)
MISNARPAFRTLSGEECKEILARNHIGRIAYSRGNFIDIEPVHYVYQEGWLYGRTSEGKKIQTTGYSWHPVAFEVDEVEDLFRWRSVVVHGGFYTIPFNGAGPEVKEWERGAELLRGLVPETFREDDPVPFRTIMFRIAVQEVSGREAIPPTPEGADADRTDALG